MISFLRLCGSLRISIGDSGAGSAGTGISQVGSQGGQGGWAQKPFFTNLFPLDFRLFQDFWAQPGFFKNCSPRLLLIWAQMALSEEMFSFLMVAHGEQINENSRLYPIHA